MSATIIKLSPLTIGRLACTSCGAETNAACNCGAPYVPAAQRVKEFDEHNPGMSNRAAAAALDVDEKTVRKARKARADQSAPDKIVGQDGKQYPAKKPRPDVEALQARATRVGWSLNHDPNGKYSLCRWEHDPKLCQGAAWVYEIRLRLCDVAGQLDNIERSPDPANYKLPDDPPKEDKPAEATTALPAPSVTIDKVKIAETRSQCIDTVRAAVDDAVMGMSCHGANAVDFGLLVDALRHIVNDAEAEIEAVS
jgi:hypothetical protein